MRRQFIIRQGIALATSLLMSGSSFIPIALAASKASPYATMPPFRSTLSNTNVNNSQKELTLGKAQIVHLPMAANRVSISNPDVVGIVVISPTEVELIGKSVGVANLLIWGGSPARNYMTIDLSVHRDVETLARKIQMIDPGINILPMAAEDSVILTGVAESVEKAQLAYDLTKAFFSNDTGAAGAGGGQGAEANSNSQGSGSFAPTSTKIINLIRVVGQPTTKAELVQARLKDIDPNIILNVVPGFGTKEKAILSGRVQNASMVSKAVNLASVFYGTPGIKVVTGPGGNAVKEGKESEEASFAAGSGGGLIGNLAGNILHGSIITDTSGNVISMLEVEERPEVKCTIKFLEVRKTNQTNFGSSFLLDANKAKIATYAGGNAQATPSGLVTQATGTGAAQVGILFGQEFAAFLSGLISTGKARVLAEPTITSISGEPSSFLAGGEFPIPVLGANGSVSVIFKEFGIRLNLKPTVTDHGTIHMQVSPEVSNLDPGSGVTINGLTIPGLQIRRSQTVLEMKDGDNFVLSGLYNDNMNDNLAKTPILGQIPIIGNLFRSKAYQRSETEMIIVIHPEITHDMNLSNTKPLVVPVPAAATSVLPTQIITPALTQKQMEETLKAFTASGKQVFPKTDIQEALKPVKPGSTRDPFSAIIYPVNNKPEAVQPAQQAEKIVPLQSVPEEPVETIVPTSNNNNPLPLPPLPEQPAVNASSRILEEHSVANRQTGKGGKRFYAHNRRYPQQRNAVARITPKLTMPRIKPQQIVENGMRRMGNKISRILLSFGGF